MQRTRDRRKLAMQCSQVETQLKTAKSQSGPRVLFSLEIRRMLNK